MEHIDVSKSIPKTEEHLYRDALIAFGTGKHLAAIFYLRSFIEQFARRLSGITGKSTGDKIMDAYYATLPERNRELMPSLRHWYDKLSEPIHAARNDEQVFVDALDEINRHFEFRRMYRFLRTPLGWHSRVLNSLQQTQQLQAEIPANRLAGWKHPRERFGMRARTPAHIKATPLRLSAIDLYPTRLMSDMYTLNLSNPFFVQESCSSFTSFASAIFPVSLSMTMTLQPGLIWARSGFVNA
jgi:hypothetical protein